MASKIQPQIITQSGALLGSENVTLAQNQVDPQRDTDIVSFECPKQYEFVEFVGRRDAVRFVPRALETFDGDGANKTFDLEGDIQPVAGETKVEDMDYPPVVVVDTTSGDEIAVESYDFAANSVTLVSAPAEGVDTVKAYPMINEGSILLRGLNQFNQSEGHLYQWSFPIYRFHDMQQNRSGREIHLKGSARFGRFERLAVTLDSPRQLVWEDEDFPEEYVSTIELDCEVSL